MNTARKDAIKLSITTKLLQQFGKPAEEASREELFEACALAVRDELMGCWHDTDRRDRNEGRKKVYYLSVEFLLGRQLASNLQNLFEEEEYREALKELGVSLSDILPEEPEPGLGNGGLGRLAACFMDSLASMDLPAMGCTIRYEYGLFRQKIENGAQVELPDGWLENGCPWEIERPEDTVAVRFGGKIEESWEEDGLHIHHTDCTTVLAVPYDIPVVGYGKERVNTLRLWSARAPERLNMAEFNRGQYASALAEREMAEVISKVLYPSDSHIEGKTLRLRQHYFFAAATMGYLVRDFKKKGLPLSELPKYAVVQINDTHPGLAIPELMRILMDEERLSFDEAWEIVTHTFRYTNHTVMSEALERWPEDLIREQLPRIYSILVAINEALCKKLFAFYPGQWERIGRMAIIGYGEVRMANLCVAGSANVNGVSRLHAEILQKDLFRDFYLITPWKFIGITNGVTHRRWLMLANPALSDLITEAIGEGWKREPERLSELLPYAKDAAFLEKLAAVKKQNKERLSNYLKETQGVSLSPELRFDVQAKRLHEYKRQLLNILHVIYLYDRLLREPDFTISPTAFLFAAKAYPDYTAAKEIILLINRVSDMIKKTPRISELLQVEFVENYCVSNAEILIPAAEVSEQISTAGKEASGTGNMKFMMNGALTVGTLDGSNVEIHDEVGDDNMFLFGLHADKIHTLASSGEYSPGRLYESNPQLRRVLDYLVSGRISPEEPELFRDLYHSLLFGRDGGTADPFFVLSDFMDYAAAQERVRKTYESPKDWNAMAVVNIARSGYFASDRTIRDYDQLLWKL